MGATVLWMLIQFNIDNDGVFCDFICRILFLLFSL